MAALIALIGEHCVFERSHILLDKIELRRCADFAVFLVDQTDQSRIYQPYIVISRRVEGDGSRYLDSELLELEGVQIHVQTEESEEDVPTRLSAKATLGREESLGEWNATVKDQLGYTTVYEVISRAITQLSESVNSPEKDENSALMEAKAKILACIRAHQDSIDYDAVVGFVNGIFGSPGCDGMFPKNRRQVIQELKAINQRLFDANIVVDKVLDPLREWIGNWPE